MKRILLSNIIACFVLSLATAQTVYYSQDFEAGVPAGWTVEEIWMHGNVDDNSSTYFDFSGNTTNFMGYNDDAAGQSFVGSGRVISTPIDLTAVNGEVFLEVQFLFNDGGFEGSNETFRLLASTDGGTTYDTLQNFTESAWDYALIDIGDFAGSMLSLAFEYDDDGAWNFGAGFDNIFISDTPVNFPRRDFILTVNGGSQLSECGMNVDYQVEGVVINRGYETINSFDITMTSADGEETTTFDGLNIKQDDGYRYALPEMLNTGESPSSHTVFISNVNGEVMTDTSIANNESIIVFEPEETHPDKAVFVEEATGTWCDLCPEGTVYLEEMSKRFGDNFVGVSVHHLDSLEFTPYVDAIISFPGFVGFPSVVFNRTNILRPGDFVKPAILDMQNAPVASIELGASENEMMLRASAKITFLEDVTEEANYRLSIILTEDEITNTGINWNQANAFVPGDTIGGYQYFPTSVPSSWSPYSRVGRALIGGFNGKNVEAGDLTAGMSTFVFMQAFQLSEDWNTDNLNIIAILTNDQGQVVNSKSGKYNDVIENGPTGTTEIVDETIASVSPNPARDIITVVNINLETPSEVSLLVMDITGNVVTNTNLGNLSGKNQHAYDVSSLANGMYLFKVTAGELTTTKKVMISK